MSPEAWIALGGLFGVGVLYAVGATVFVLTLVNKSERRALDKNESCYNLAVTKLEAGLEKEAKARHDLANEMQRVTSQLVIEDKDLAKRLNAVVSDMVSKADLVAHEARMSVILEKLDTKLESLDAKFDTKIEGLSAKILARA